MPCVRSGRHFIGMSPSGKAPDFDSGIRRFKSGHPSHDPLAQLAEQLPFKQWVWGSNPQRVPKRNDGFPKENRRFFCSLLFTFLLSFSRRFQSKVKRSVTSRPANPFPLQSDVSPKHSSKKPPSARMGACCHRFKPNGRPHLSRKPPQRMTIRSITAPMPKIPAVVILQSSLPLLSHL